MDDKGLNLHYPREYTKIKLIINFPNKKYPEFPSNFPQKNPRLPTIYLHFPHFYTISQISPKFPHTLPYFLKISHSTPNFDPHYQAKKNWREIIFFL